jgi:hypothetical protein
MFSIFYFLNVGCVAYSYSVVRGIREDTVFQDLKYVALLWSKHAS